MKKKSLVDAQPLKSDQATKEEKNKREPSISQFSWGTRSQQGAEDQAQIERPDVNQKSLENVLVSPQMRPSHPTRVVAVRKAPLDQLITCLTSFWSNTSRTSGWRKLGKMQRRTSSKRPGSTKGTSGKPFGNE